MKSLTAFLFACLLTLGLRAADQPAASAYPLTTCVVSGESLTEMGGPVDYVYKQEGKPDRVVKFCCKMCISKFKKDPAKYLAILDAAAAKNAAPAQ